MTIGPVWRRSNKLRLPDSAHPERIGRSANAAASESASAVPAIKMTTAPANACLLEVGRELGPTAEQNPTIIALGSPKGGTGKSTTAMLLTVALLKLGHKVGSVDLDGQQATMSQYLANRGALIGEIGEPLEMPRHFRIRTSLRTSRDLGEQEEKRRLQEALHGLADCTYVVIDTPGNDCHVARLGCIGADTVITPLNDSLLDINVLARIDPRKRVVLGPSEYSRMIWQENDRRVACGRRPIDWVVIRNRQGYVQSRNTQEVSCLLQQLSHRVGFRLAEGLSERVVFRELFLNGLTLLDLPSEKVHDRHGRGLESARREVDNLLRAVGVPRRSPTLGQVC